MKTIKWAGAALLLVLGTIPAASAALSELWETTGLKTPESALPDPSGTFAYVSSIDGDPLAKDDNGFISKVSLKDGKIEVLKWATGLSAPKGMALVGDKLYVSDIDRLVAIDTATGKTAAEYPTPGAGFLNDVAADSEGRVYASDSGKSTIWRLADGKIEKWMEGPELKYPNGLLARGDKLIIAAWGAPNADGTNAKANLLEIDIATKSVRDLGSSAPVGNLDGIEPLSDTSFLVTDWIAGALFIIDAKGDVEHLLDLNQGSADIGWLPNERLLLIPMMKDDKLVAYRVK